MKTLAILVGGGPAPGINAVIAAATIEARNRGLRVLGCEDGFKWLMLGDVSRVHELDIGGLSQIHFEGGSILRTARANPTRSPEALQHVVESLRRLDVSYLLTIGGDDTAFATSEVARAAGGRMAVVHVPKTIDNDLPLPPEIPTFGFTTAVDLGMQLVRNLMKDAATTGKWFFVTVMGRHAGHLALGIGGAAGATLTVIGEEFPERHVPIQRLADILEGAIVKRLVHGRDHGVALLAEGLLVKLDPKTLGTVARDAYGNVRLQDWSWHDSSRRGWRRAWPRGVSRPASWPRISATSCAVPRRGGSTSSTAGASATGRRASCSTAAAKRWPPFRAAASFRFHSGICSIRRPARSAFAMRISTRKRTAPSTPT